MRYLQEKAETSNHDIEAHQCKARANPGKEGPFGGQMVTRAAEGALGHLFTSQDWPAARGSSLAESEQIATKT